MEFDDTPTPWVRRYDEKRSAQVLAGLGMAARTAKSFLPSGTVPRYMRSFPVGLPYTMTWSPVFSPAVVTSDAPCMSMFFGTVRTTVAG